MKTLEVILVLGFVLQVSNAGFRVPEFKKCLIDNGFTDDMPDMLRVEAIGDPKEADRLKDVPIEKMAGLIACLYEKHYGDKNLKGELKSLVERDDKVTEEDREKMLETLTTCNTNAAGDNTKLLSCLNIVVPPFDHVIGVIRDIPAYVCFPKCRVTIGEMYRIHESRARVKGLLGIINEQKLGCFLACIVDEGEKKHPDQDYFQGLTDMINESEKHDVNQKREMLETLNKCKTQVAAVENKSLEFIKCINLFKPPFIDLY